MRSRRPQCWDLYKDNLPSAGMIVTLGAQRSGSQILAMSVALDAAVTTGYAVDVTDDALNV